jgi:hypothetical protein
MESRVENIMKTHLVFFNKVLLSLLLLTLAQWSLAEAYCALRDPVAGIYKLYPQATGYRSIVRTIDESTRNQVRTSLPPNTLHFGELGRHTLYVALQDDTPIGLVHVRSEASKWGLVEIAWAINLDLSVHDFAFQRARSSARRLLEAPDFRNQLVGKNYQTMKDLLKGGTTADPEKLRIPKSSEGLSSVLLRSGLKTLLITRLAWQQDLQKIWLLSQAKLSFPTAYELKFNKPVFNEHLLTRLDQEFGAASTGLHRDTAQTAKVIDLQGNTLGAIYSSQAAINGYTQSLYWSIDPQHNLLKVSAVEPWLDANSKNAFKKLNGRSFLRHEDCSNQQELMALEATLMISQLLE